MKKMNEYLTNLASKVFYSALILLIAFLLLTSIEIAFSTATGKNLYITNLIMRSINEIR